MKKGKKLTIHIISAATFILAAFFVMACQLWLHDSGFGSGQKQPGESADTSALSRENGTSAETGKNVETEEKKNSPENPEAGRITENKPSVGNSGSYQSLDEFLKSSISTADALNSCKKISEYSFREGTTVTLLTSFDSVFSRSKVQKPVYQRIQDEKYAGYTTTTTYTLCDRPYVSSYMDYYIIDSENGGKIYSADGTLLLDGIDLSVFSPAYTRNSEGIPQFTDPDGKYYMLRPTNSDGGETDTKTDTKTDIGFDIGKYELVESSYNDAAEGRGLYFNYPSYFGLSDNDYLRYYNGRLYGYGTESGRMRSSFRYNSAFEFSEGAAAVADADGILNYINTGFYYKIFGTKTYRNLSGRRVTSNYYLPDINGVESLGFYYFSKGAVRVRKREVDGYYTDRILSDRDIVIRIDGSEYPIPTDYQVISYSDGIFLLKNDAGYGYMDYTGKWIFDPFLSEANPFFEGLATVQENGLYGMINTEGYYVIPPLFEYIQDCSCGVIPAYSNGRWYIFNKVEDSEYIDEMLGQASTSAANKTPTETIAPPPETTAPAEDTTAPTGDTTAPTESSTAPTEDTTAPAEGTTAPAEGTTAPTEGTTVPTEGTTAPTESTTATIDDTTTPTEDTTVPTEDTTTPTENTTAPAESTTAPTETTTAPTEDTTAPTEGTTVPTEGTTVPTEGTTAPTEDTTAPAEGTTSPAEDTTVPTDGTTAPTEGN